MYIQQAEFYDGHYDLHPSAATFLNLEDELTDLHATEIDLDWATRRIKQGFLDWVSSAVVIKKVFRFRLWKEKFANWKEYCHKAIGKKAELVKVMLDRADVVIELAKAGFEILPTNQSQVDKLLSCCKKLDCMVYDGWERVLSALPPSLITADAIAETLGFPASKERLNVPKELGDRLTRAAVEQGMSRQELHQQILENWLDEVDGGTDSEDSEEVAEPEPEAIEAWEADLEELVVEHEGEIWLLATLTKLAKFVTQSTNQFSWLREYRHKCRTT